MYNVFIPVMNNKYSQKQLTLMLGELKRAECDAVFLTFPRVLRSPAMLKESIELFRRNKEFFEGGGITVNAWLYPTIGYGGTGTPSYFDNDAGNVYTKIKFAGGSEVFAYCPLDGDFTDDFCRTLLALADTGVKAILFEDDFTLSGGKILSDVGCCCDRHIKLFGELTGEKVTLPEINVFLKESAPNGKRDAWLKMNGDTLRNFCRKIDKVIHEKHPDVRLGLSANNSSFLLEGVDISELCHIISGNTKPFMRLTGAPYWKNAMTQSSNIEAIRLQTSWCDGIDLMTEGDTYPRPRCWVPANYLECYDMILRADHSSDSILKYMIDYTSNALFETGYIDRHIKNKKHYEEIGRRFGGKTTVGVNIFENTDLYRKIDFLKDVNFSEYGNRGYLPTMSQWMICDNSLPTAYGVSGWANICFGANAKYVTEKQLKEGLVLDAVAANILFNKGIDVGFTSSHLMKNPLFEYFIDEDDYCSCALDREGIFYNFKLADGAKVLSEFCIADNFGLGTSLEQVENCERFPACYIYENADGYRFTVYSFVPHSVYVTSYWNKGLFRNYYRQKQLAEGIEFVQRKPLPAMCYKNPELYVLCRKDEHSMAVGLWNIFPDEVLSPEIILDGCYSSVDFYNCSGRLEGCKVVLNEEINPYGFAFFTVYK